MRIRRSEPDAFVECSYRVLVPAGFYQQGTFLVVCLGIVLVLRKSPFKGGDGLIVLTELCKCETFLVQGVCIIGADLQRVFVSRNRFTEPPEVGIRQPLLERSRGASGVKGKDLFE